MPAQPPLPPLLAPYVSALPQSSLTLLSSVLGATGNWLILRYLYSALGAPTGDAAFGLHGSEDGRKRKVVLVSFLRGWEFWRSEAKRLVGYLHFSFLLSFNLCDFPHGMRWGELYH